jgi:hypothetical protein
MAEAFYLCRKIVKSGQAHANVIVKYFLNLKLSFKLYLTETFLIYSIFNFKTQKYL